jgi:hypothetical protein
MEESRKATEIDDEMELLTGTLLNREGVRSIHDVLHPALCSQTTSELHENSIGTPQGDRYDEYIDLASASHLLFPILTLIQKSWSQLLCLYCLVEVQWFSDLYNEMLEKRRQKWNDVYKRRNYFIEILGNADSSKVSTAKRAVKSVMAIIQQNSKENNESPKLTSIGRPIGLGLSESDMEIAGLHTNTMKEPEVETVKWLSPNERSLSKEKFFKKMRNRSFEVYYELFWINYKN